MSSYLDYMMYGGNGFGQPRNLYDQQIAQYQQQLSQYQQNLPYNNLYQNQPIMPQQPMQQPVQQPMQQSAPGQLSQNDPYLQSLFMEFLRSPEMKDFTSTFYSKFSQFYKNKTGLDYPAPNFISNQINTPTPSINNNIPQPSTAPQRYVIEQ